MTYTADFYRGRIEDKLGSGFWGDARQASQVVPPVRTEAALLAIADDVEFVRQAYRFYLKRDPDLGGFQYFSDLVEAQGRQAVVDGICNSDEGRQLGLSQAPAQPAGISVDGAPSHTATAPATVSLFARIARALSRTDR